MTRFMKLSILGAALALPATAAFADTIPVSGSIGVGGAATMTTSGTSITSFTLSNGSIQTVGADAGSTISPYYTVGNAVTVGTPATYSTTGAVSFASTGSTMGGKMLFSTLENGKYLNFWIDNYTVITNTESADGTYGTVTIHGNGYFTETGFATQIGTFTLNVNQTGTVTFSGNQITTAIAATPEPSSLMLLGTGLVSAAGLALRKRKLA